MLLLKSCLSCSVTIVAFVRLVYCIKFKADAGPANVTTYLSNVLIWTGVEVNMSLVCACLPSLRPIATSISETFCLSTAQVQAHVQEALKITRGHAKTRQCSSCLAVIEEEKLG